SLPNATTITPYPGNYVYSLLNDNNYFIVETNEGWIFIDENNVSTTFNHNIPDYLPIVTKKTTKYDSDNGIINIIHKGFDAAFNYRVYKTQCNTITGICSPSEEIFTNDRDLTQNILFGVEEDLNTNEVVAVGVKTNSSGNVKRTELRWSKSLNDMPLTLWDEDHPLYPLFDCIVVAASVSADDASIYIPDENTIQVRTEDPNSGNPVIIDNTLDVNDDGTLDVVKATGNAVITEGDVIGLAFIGFIEQSNEGFARIIKAIDQELNSNNQQRITTNVSGIDVNIKLPSNVFIPKFELILYNSTEALLAILTSYGLLIKTGVDVSQLTLSTEDTIVKNNEPLIYPNPSSNMVSFLGDTIASATIYDVNGRFIKDVKSSSFSVKDLAKGVYILKAKTNTGASISRKLIKN
ncbi:MAG: T9SS type A sorting domain-containing protein, partial [Winogradskyella sp.]|nr:T9SS type A sorting domain-containing protein [Winogradskyella sp.]